ncbi:uncharacterized protein LOC122263045 [Penaeus japonicus]|uniref:uncharacterized protein LOC122263045 n=1 Tax=Penaeus japonicus TaxID=27405 RepID=UPI001C70B971|nr:uncharacterized protein LOC122263045 [Penaeus japonicus]
MMLRRYKETLHNMKLTRIVKLTHHFLGLLVIAVGVCGEKALLFQPNNEITTASRAVTLLDGGSSEPIIDLSVCTWLKVTYFREKTYVYSYATSDKNNNELNMGIKEHSVLIAIAGKYVSEPANQSYVPDVWYHSCFVIHNESLSIYIDGEKRVTKSRASRGILLNGSLVLGQETDLVLGGFNEQQSFSGVLTGFNLYNRSLTDGEVASLAGCAGKVPEGDLVAWSRTSWILEGPALQIDVNPEEYCRQRSRTTVFPKQMTRVEALSWCTNIKAAMALPRSTEENEELYDAARPFVGVCQPPNHAKGFFWIGATDEAEKGVWTDLKGELLTFTNFKGTYKSGSLDCGIMLIPPNDYEWDDAKCSNTYSFCVGCTEEVPSVLRVRGLCESDRKAGWFRLTQERGQILTFRGFTKYVIYFDTATNKWEFRDTWKNLTLATYYTYDASYPFGTREWTLISDYDVCGKPNGSSHTLAVSGCYDWEYSCSDATCINLHQRCDLRIDCPDASDETDCDKLLLPKDYIPYLTPAGVKPGPLGMNLSMVIQGFSEVNIRDLKLTVDFTLSLSWFDGRLRYQNLKPLEDVNHVKEDDVWTPGLEYVNADFPRVHKTPAVVTVSRFSEPVEDDPALPRHDEIYEGSENSLRFSQKVNAPFSCVMNLRNFPFDTQRCRLLLRLTSARQDFLLWEDLNVSYVGEVLLTEYEVGNVTVESQVDRDYSLAIITITFYRRFWFYITSAYLPTVMLMMISYASLFIKRENDDLRVMMTLTTLLVLYALYQQISDGLPRTSYTKAVDVWCFFAITFIFTKVIFHVLVDLQVKLRTARFRWMRGQGVTKDLWDDEESRSRKRLDIMKVAKILYAAVAGVFLAVYWVVVISAMEA